jgi:uncharacterized protein YecE (DUF72 family)
LIRDGTFYPSRSLNAAQRLAHYASRLPLTEVATTYRFPPTPEVAQRWVSSTPPGFTIDVRCWSLLCGAPTWPESLWPDLQGEIRPPARGGSKLYRHHLPAEVVDECWDRFHHAVRPLQQAGRLGAVIVRFPSWFSPRPAAVEELATLPERLSGFRVAVELGNPRWLEGHACDETLALLEALGLSYVCRDRAGPDKPVVAATADMAIVRFPGRAGRWWEGDERRSDESPSEPVVPAAIAGAAPSVCTAPPVGDGGAGSTDPVPAGATAGGGAWDVAPWAYRYSDAELEAWVPSILDLASCTSQVHLIMDNCWRSDAVDNASNLLRLVAAARSQTLGRD